MTSDDHGDDGNKDQSPKKRRISYKARASTKNRRNTTEKTTKIPKDLQNIPSDNIRHGIRMGIAPAQPPTASSQWEHRAWLATAPHIENNNCVLATSDDGSAQFPNYSTREVTRRLRTSKESRSARASSIRELDATPPHNHPCSGSNLGAHINQPSPLHTGLRDGLFSTTASSSRDRLRSTRRSSRLASSTNPLPERGSYGKRLASKNTSEPVTRETLPPRLSHPYTGATSLLQGSTTGHAKSTQLLSQEEFVHASYLPDERSFAVESRNTTLPYLPPTATPRGVVGVYPSAELSIAPRQVPYHTTIGASHFVDNWDLRFWQGNPPYPYPAPQVDTSAFYPQPDVAGPHPQHEDSRAFAHDVSHDWEQSGGYQHQVHGQLEPQPSSHQALDSFPMANPNMPLPVTRVEAALNTPSFGGQVGYTFYNLYWGPPSSPR